MKLLSSFIRPLNRGVAFMRAAANLRSALCLALYSNHRTFALATRLGRMGIKLKMTGDSPVFLDFGSSDDRTIFIEIFLERVYQLEHLNFKPEVILDCGAHIGLFSRLAFSFFPEAKLYAFEPNLKNFERLKSQCSQIHRSFRLFNVGVGTQDCSAFLTGDGCQGIVSVSCVSAGASGQRIQIIDLKNWITGNLECESLLIKIDVEGGEFDLIPHILAVVPKRTVILFETHSFAGNDENLLLDLQNHNFQVSLLRSRIDNNERFADYIATRG